MWIRPPSARRPFPLRAYRLHAIVRGESDDASTSRSRLINAASVHVLARRDLHMLTAYSLTESGPRGVALADGGAVPAGRSWIDLPSRRRRRTARPRTFSAPACRPARKPQEIEFSSRFYAEDGAVFMTASVLTGVDIGEAGARAVDHRRRRRQASPRCATRTSAPAASSSPAPTKPGSGCTTTPGRVPRPDRGDRRPHRRRARTDQRRRRPHQPRDLCRAPATARRAGELAQLIGDIGLQGDLAAKARESLSSLERLVQFASLALPAAFAKGPTRTA